MLTNICQTAMVLGVLIVLVGIIMEQPPCSPKCKAHSHAVAGLGALFFIVGLIILLLEWIWT